MDFSLTPDQQLLRDTAHKLIERECPPALVRAHIDDPSVYEQVWRHLAEFTDLAQSDASDTCLFLEETGYAAAPGPFLATMLFQTLTDQHDALGTVALIDDPTLPFILEADRVERIAFVQDGTFAVVDRADVAVEFVPTVDFSRRLFSAQTDVVPTSPVPDDWRDRAHVYLAAEMVGVARRIFDMALQYAKERYQFDVPIGSFQAIQHKLADMSLALERATAAVHYAAMTIDAADEDRSPGRARGQGRRGRGSPPDPEGRHPDPRRRRLHVGARPPPLLEAGHRRRVPARNHRLAPRPPRRPHHRLNRRPRRL